ncbi:MAG: hypothetical protein SNF33_05035 [Candidatus Algichlamydia australiensis]|nr:hypothetical protein [Chlamydiales bacterium]
MREKNHLRLILVNFLNYHESVPTEIYKLIIELSSDELLYLADACRDLRLSAQNALLSLIFAHAKGHNPEKIEFFFTEIESRKKLFSSTLRSTRERTITEVASFSPISEENLLKSVKVLFPNDPPIAPHN